MKFNFNTIEKPTLDENNRNIVNGFLPDGSAIKVERRLDGWDIRLKITVNGTVYHDAEFEEDEKKPYNILRESAMNFGMNQEDTRRANNHKIARQYLMSADTFFN